MYAIVYADEGEFFIGEISETLYAARPMVKIECPATSMQLGRTLLLDVGSVRLIRMLPSAALTLAPAHTAGAVQVCKRSPSSTRIPIAEATKLICTRSSTGTTPGRRSGKRTATMTTRM